MRKPFEMKSSRWNESRRNQNSIWATRYTASECRWKGRTKPWSGVRFEVRRLNEGDHQTYLKIPNDPLPMVHCRSTHREERWESWESIGLEGKFIVRENKVGWGYVPFIQQDDHSAHYFHEDEVQFDITDACFLQVIVALCSLCSSVVQYDSWELECGVRNSERLINGSARFRHWRLSSSRP